MSDEREPRRITRTPTCLAVVLCDTIIEDVLTHKRSLIGLFNVIGAAKYPSVHPSAALLASLVDGLGRTPLEVRLGNLATGREILRLKGEVVFNDPTSVVELVLRIQGLPLPEPGHYIFELLHNEVPIGARRFQAVLAPAGSPGTPGTPEAPSLPGPDGPGGTE